jgi:hypothetical protein
MDYELSFDLIEIDESDGVSVLFLYYRTLEWSIEKKHK